jgi:hypothetical protein
LGLSRCFPAIWPEPHSECPLVCKGRASDYLENRFGAANEER